MLDLYDALAKHMSRSGDKIDLFEYRERRENSGELRQYAEGVILEEESIGEMPYDSFPILDQNSSLVQSHRGGGASRAHIGS